MTVALGVELGEALLRIVSVDDDGHIVADQRLPAAPPAKAWALILAEASRAGAAVVGVAWDGDPAALRRIVELDLTAAPPLLVDTRARCATWAEHCFGAAAGASHSVLVLLREGIDGDGIDGGAVLDHRLQRGHRGQASRYGHLRAVPAGRSCPCGLRGCWQQYAGGRALALGLQERGSHQQWTAGQVLDAAGAGEQQAASAVADVARWLGVGLAKLAAVLDPEVFVLGGLLDGRAELLLEPVRAAFARHWTAGAVSTPARIVASRLGDDAVVLGAAALARA